MSAGISLAVADPAGVSGAPAHAGAESRGAESQSPGPVRRLEVGPDRIVCGVTAPPDLGGKAGRTGPRPGLILWFHGGMRSRNPEKGLEAHRPLLSFVDPHAWVLASPSAFAGHDWLSPEALATTESLIDSLIRRYAIDTGDIRLIGVSDGCLAVIRYGSEGRRAVKRKVLVSSLPQLAISREDLPTRRRLAEGRWDFLQGGWDSLFPSSTVLPFLRQWEGLYPNARVHFYPEGEHDFAYYAAHASGLLRDLFRAGDPPGTGAGKPQKPKKG